MQNIIWNIIEAANVILEFSIVLLYFSKLLKPKYERTTLYILGYSFAALTLYVTGIFTSNSTILISTTFILLVLISIILYEGSLIRSFFLSLLFIVIVFISEILFMGIMAALNIGLPSEIVMPGFKRIIGMVGTKIIYFWIIVFVCRLINKKIR